jgi:hypothetical protein
MENKCEKGDEMEIVVVTVNILKINVTSNE